MIEYLEIRDATRKLIGMLDIAKSVIWEVDYYGAGRFEIYTPLTGDALQMLQMGYFLTRPNEANAAIIEAIEYTDSAQDGAMSLISGRMAKSILDRRLVYRLNGNQINPVKISGNVATAVQSVVRAHAGQGANAARTMGVIIGSNGGITQTITSKEGNDSTRQSSYNDLLTFTDSVLQEYACGALIRINEQNQLIYDCFEGQDRSVGNTAGNTPVIFSQDFENLLTAEYTEDTTLVKNFALIGGEGEGLARFYTTFDQDGATGLARREVFVNAQSIPRKYKPEGSDEEQEYTASQYSQLLTGQAQTQLKELVITKTFRGEINLIHSPYKYGKDADFWLGDIVTVQDNALGLYANVRILKATEVQDESGYLLSVEYGN
ncbi:MAG: siphovirus ReqiPepy6 Gp37-like family protein [Prevotella sp.]|nr:siphovirus ReqiPepy6 Gp37-like family protein [Prevotella sp.]